MYRHVLLRMQEVVKLVMGTWQQQQAGIGRDAHGPRNSRIEVEEVWTVQNPILYKEYFDKRSSLIARGLRPAVDQLRRQPPVMTSQIGCPQ